MTTAKGTLHDEILAAADRWGDAPFQRAAPAGKRGADRVVTSYAEFAEQVRAAARGLIARGLRPGDRVAIVSENRPAWLVVDLAILAAGGIDVPRGLSAPPEEVALLVRHSGSRFAVVEDAAALRKYRAALEGVEQIFVLDGDAPDGDAPCGVESLRDLCLAAKSDCTLPAVAADDVATIVYTSGTTGDPKGVTLTHANVLANIRALPEVLPLQPGERFLALLPTWHMYERTVEYFCAWRGGELAYTDLRRFKQDLAGQRPHFIVSVPRVWESLHDGVRAALRTQPAPVRIVAETALAGSVAFRRALRVLRGHTVAAADGQAGAGARLGAVLGLALWPLHALAGLLVYRRLHAATGGRLRLTVSGGGALPEHVDAFLDAAGLIALIGYGLTETSPVVAVRRAERNVLGTIGTPLSGTELSVHDPETGAPTPGAVGVLRVRGPQVMQGYWENEQATRAVLLADGWFDTGDLCRVTAAGDIVFCGRAKDTIVLRGGENAEPEPLEQAALASPLIAQIVVVGQDRKGLGALVWPDPDYVAAQYGPTAEPDRVKAAVVAELRARLGAAGGFRAWERIVHVALLPAALSAEDGTLTATLKVRRAVVVEQHQGLIEEIYADRR